jgi:hypothetical protein
MTIGKRYYSPDNVAPTEPALIENMTHNLEKGYVYFEFSDDPDFETLKLPAAGSLVTVTASENNFAYGSVPDGDAIDVSIEDYTRPIILGSIESAKATPTNVTGVNYWRLIVARF